jgi:uncharacterized OB-fold protein
MKKQVSIRSSRTLKITYNLPISRTQKFWREMGKGKFLATKCKKCSKLYFPPITDCGNCGSSDVEWVRLKGEGRVVTFTQIFIKPASFEKERDYLVVIVKLKEGIKVLAWLKGIDRENTKIGMRVKFISNVTSDGRVFYSFIPV